MRFLTIRLNLNVFHGDAESICEPYRGGLMCTTGTDDAANRRFIDAGQIFNLFVRFSAQRYCFTNFSEVVLHDLNLCHMT